MYFLYSFVLTIGFLLLMPRFLWDAARGGKYAAGFWQKLGYLPDFAARERKIIWLHCVSVGETNAAKPLAQAILTDFPEYALVVSTTTRTGQKLARDIFKNDAALIFYFPFDWRFVVRRVFKHLNPAAVFIMETELWFNFLREAKHQNVKVALVNGRLSEKSFRNYKIIRGLMRKVLANLDLALMSGAADAARLIELGCDAAKVAVTGNVKFDLPIIAAEDNLTKNFRARFDFNDSRPVIIAASTHEPEEKWILAAFRKLRENNLSARLVLVPRHPERFNKVADLIRDNDFDSVRRSSPASRADADAAVILLDSIGELRAIYPLAAIVFVGGSLISHGGQNILEPAAAQKAVVTGFHTANFAAIVKTFLAENAVVQLPELPTTKIPDALAEIFNDLLKDDEKRADLAQNAVTVLTANAGATARTISRLKDLLK